MAATEVASLMVTIGGDVSGLKNGLKTANQKVGNFGQKVGEKLSNIGGSFQNLGGQITIATAPLALGFAAGITAAASFEQTMAEIQSRTGLTADEMARVSEFALQMGADTAFSGQQAADAMLQLLTSGSSVEEAFALLPLVLDAAAASGEDLGTTADTLTDILASFGLEAQALAPNLREIQTQFGLTADVLAGFDNADLIDETHLITQGMQDLAASIGVSIPELQAMVSGWDQFIALDPVDELDQMPPGMLALAEALGVTTQELWQMLQPTEDAATVVDSLARAAGASSANMADLGAGFANVGGVAAAFGLSVNDTAAALAIFSENGIKGAEAGTQLKSMLMNMTRDVDEVDGAWAALGTSLYDAEGNVRNLETVLIEMGTALDAMPVQRQNELLQTLGGSYGSLGLRALLGSISIGEMNDRMAASAGASEVAEARMDTFAGRVDSLKGSVETLMITALTPLMNDVLKPLAEEATKVVNQFTAWAEANPQLAQGVVAIAGAATIAGPILIAVGTAFKFIGIAVAALTSPLALIAAGIGTIIALAPRIPEGIATWAENFRNLGVIVETVFTDIARRVAVAVSDITRGIQTKIAELQVSVLQGQALLGTADPAAVQRAIDDLATLYSADKINAALEAQIGSQDIDLSQMISFTLPGGATFSHSIATILAGVDPSIMGEGLKWQIEDAIKVAITTADMTELPALLLAAENFGIELDPAVIQSQIVTQVQAAIASGDQEGYLALMQLALQLGLNPQEIQQQATTQTVTAVEAITPQAQVGITVISNVVSDVAGQVSTFLGGLPYSATATASIFINPLVQFTQSIQSIIANMISGMNVDGTGDGTGTDVPQHRYGSDYTREGLAYLHEGERVLTRQENREFGRGGMGGSTTTILNVNAMGTPYQMADQIGRAYRNKGRGR